MYIEDLQRAEQSLLRALAADANKLASCGANWLGDQGKMG